MILKFAAIICENYKEMYKKWSALSDSGFFTGK